MTTQYTTILKLALPVQGELSGTWGDVVNDNITEMVEQAIAGKAVVNTWTGNSHTLTTADGTTAESRCAILELTDTGTALTGAGTVVCPTNTKLYIVDNNTAQIITTKTSGGTGVAVPVGKTMLVYCDGTNVVEGVTHANSLSLGTSTVTVSSVLDQDDMSSDSATALATQQSIKAYVDSQVGTVDTLSEILANGNATGGTDIAVGTGDDITFADSSKAIFGAGSDLSIYHNGSTSVIEDSGTGNLQIRTSTLAVVNAAGTEVILQGVEDGAVSLYYDAGARLATSSAGIQVTGDIANTSGNLTLDVAGDIILDADGGDVFLRDAGSEFGRFQGSSQDFLIRNDTQDKDISIVGNDGGSTITALAFDMSEAGAATFNSTVAATGIDVTGTATMDGLTVSPSGTQQVLATLRANSGAGGGLVVQTDASDDGLIRGYDSSGAVQIQFDTDGGDSYIAKGNVGIGTDSPSYPFHVTGSGDTVAAVTAGASSVAALNLGNSTNLADGGIRYDNSANALILRASNTERLRIDASGLVGIGSSAMSSYNTNFNDLVVDGGNNTGITVVAGATGDGTLAFANGTTGDAQYRGYVQYTHASDKLYFGSGGVLAMTIDSSQNVGIGSSSPSFQTGSGLEIQRTTATATMRLEYTGSNAFELSAEAGQNTYNAVSSLPHVFEIGSVEKMQLDASGRVGIGRVPSLTNSKLEVGGADNVSLINVEASGVTGGMGIGSTGLQFFHGSTARMRIDSSGNFMVGKTASGIANSGFEVGQSGQMNVTQASAVVGRFNRKTSEGSILELQQDGVPVGSIGNNTDFFVASADGAGVRFSASQILPCSESGATQNGSRDLGSSSARFQDLWLSGGVRATSTLDITIPETSGGAIQLEFGNNTNTTRRTVRAYKDNFEPNTADTGVISLGQSANKWKDLWLSGVAYNGDGSASAPSISFGADTNTGFYRVGSDQIGFVTAGSIKAKLDASGNLLVGKTASNYATEGVEIRSNEVLITKAGLNPLSVRGSGDGSLISLNTDGTTVGSIGTTSGRLEIQGNSNPVRIEAGTSNIQVNNNTHISFDIASSEAMRINSGGSVLIGCTTFAAGGGGHAMQASGARSSSRDVTTNAYHNLFYNANGLVGGITTNGSATTYATSSDQRLKENIADADDSGSKVDAIQVRKFDWKADGSHQDYGMVAQELLEVAPEAVSAPEDPEEMMGVDYSKLVPMMLKEIQSLRARVAQLES